VITNCKQSEGQSRDEGLGWRALWPTDRLMTAAGLCADVHGDSSLEVFSLGSSSVSSGCKRHNASHPDWLVIYHCDHVRSISLSIFLSSLACVHSENRSLISIISLY